MEKGESSSASLGLVISTRQDPSSYYGLMVAPLTKSINKGGVSAALRLVNVSTFVYFHDPFSFLTLFSLHLHDSRFIPVSHSLSLSLYFTIALPECLQWT